MSDVTDVTDGFRVVKHAQVDELITEAFERGRGYERGRHAHDGLAVLAEDVQRVLDQNAEILQTMERIEHRLGEIEADTESAAGLVLGVAQWIERQSQSSIEAKLDRLLAELRAHDRARL